MGKTAKRWWTILIATKTICSGLLWARSLLCGSIKIIGDMELHPPFFFIIFMVGIAIIVGLNYSWISAWIGPKLKTDRQRFYECYPEILAMRQACAIHFHSDRVVRNLVQLPLFYANVIEIGSKLTKLGIECPSVSPNNEDFVLKWFNFVVALVPLVKNKDLESAQGCLGKLNQLEKEDKSQKS